MNIRTMQPADIDRILEITRIAWGDYTLHKLKEDKHGLIGNRDWAERKMAEVKSFCEGYPENVIVAVEDDRVVGYATFIMNKEDKSGEVGNNAVDPLFQGKGIGTSMIGWIIDCFRREGMRMACVSTLAHDVPAQRMYEKNGFKELARSIHYTMDL